MSDFDSVLRAFEQHIAQQEAALLRGLERGAEQLTEAGQGADSYNQQSGATREGTIAYVSTAENDGSAVFNAAKARVEDKNPGQSIGESGPAATPDAPMIVFTVPTSYQFALELANGGDHAFLAPLLDANAPQIHAAIEDELRQVS